MKITYINLIVAFVLLSISCYGHSEISATDIMEKVYTRYDGDTRISRQSISTCKYGLKNKSIACIEQPRIKVSENYGKDFGNRGEDSKSLTLIVEPASERGIGILQYDYEDITREADQWIYLSALGKPKRVAAGNQDEDEPKKGSMFGSEFALEDLEKARAKDYTATILKEVIYKKRPCWIVQLIPTPEKARKSSYSKMVAWIDKERYVEHKVQYYDRKGLYVKKKTQIGWEKKGNVWFARKLIMDNLISKRISVMETHNISFNVSIDDEFLSLRSLTDASFRERNMRELKTEQL